MTTAHIDADVLRYEIGHKCQGGEHGPLHFDTVAEMIYVDIENIRRAAGADDVVIYLTGSKNFRDEIAVTKPYKGQRKSEKPFHWHNITAYLHNQYTVRIVEGLEADDLMALDQREDTVICTRDKDLRMVPGWHYGWECGAQREFPLQYVDEIGKLELDVSKKPAKLKGTGLKFFYSQLLTGDAVDNIPGLPRCGAVGAFEHLEWTETEEQMFSVVQNLYHEKGYDDEYLLEQGRLLWMTRELHPDGSPVLWSLPYED